MIDDLELVTTEVLINELLRRFEHGVFAGMNVVVHNKDGTGDNYARHAWKGCSLTCAGLAAESQARILKERNEPEE